MGNYLYAVPSSWPRGPHTLDELRALRDQGRLTDDTLVSEENADRWVKLGVLLGTVAAEPGAALTPVSGAPSARLADNYSGGEVSWFLLTIGQIAAALACVAIPIGVLRQLAGLAEAERLVEQARRLRDARVAEAVGAIQLSRVYVLIAGTLAFCLSAALFIVFKRAKAAAVVATSQDAENQRIWRAIEELRSNGSSSSPGPK